MESDGSSRVEQIVKKKIKKMENRIKFSMLISNLNIDRRNESI